MNGEQIFNEISVSFKKSSSQKGLFSSSHVKYDVTITYGNVSKVFSYQCNPLKEDITKYRVIECIIDEYFNYVNAESYEDFCEEFGYDEWDNDSKKIYTALEVDCKKVESLFFDDEIDELGIFFAIIE